ncbi:virulence factor TspB C-terminal domain-related protein [Acinetobacter guillouiae]|uniref:virulence factor TspB C-terminal domain-related protein n=1 Tax=Acinetobacter guillouiae TaxID=106649 RepID=UPI003AF89DFC
MTIQNWKNQDEWLNLNDSMLSKFTGTTVCSNSCVHKFDFLGDSTGDATNGPVTFKGKYVSTTQTCTSPTQGPVATLNGTKTPTSDGCKNGESYCDKPPTGCPSGYSSGSFNGKQICVKNNPDPTQPNPNDPNNGGGKFDDSRIIAAINDSKNAITSSINNAVNSISQSINSINESISSVTNAVNGTTNAVNANTSATNAVKSSVDTLHNTINAVTTAVNNNTSAVTSAVNSNTSATNAVKASVDALNSTVSAVTNAVDKNTTAVNANGDKVAKAVNDNTTATNSVKTAVENLNSAVNAVSDAVNSNGKNTVDAVNANGKNTVDAVNSVKSAIDSLNTSVNAVTSAVNANGDKVTNAVNQGTEATKENGKKLDQIIKGQEEGNSLFKDIKDWLTGDNNLPENEKPTIEEYDVGDYEKSYVSWSASCPPDVQIPISLLGQSSTLVLKWSPWCELLSKIRWAIIACAYFSAAYIILGMRG